MPRGRPKGSKNKPRIAAKPTRVAAAPAAPRSIAKLRISAAGLKRSMIESAALLEENKDRTRTANEIKRNAIERGCDPKAFGLCLSLWRQSHDDLHKVASFLRSFDRIRDALAFDAMIPADFFEPAVEGRKSHLEAVEMDDEADMAAQTPTPVDIPVEGYEPHPAA